MNSKSRGLVYILVGTIIFLIGLVLIFEEITVLGAIIIAFAGVPIFTGFSVLINDDTSQPQMDAQEKTKSEAHNPPPVERAEKELNNPLSGIYIKINGVWHSVTASSKSDDADLIKMANSEGVVNGDTITFRGKRYAKKDNMYYLIENTEPYALKSYNAKTEILAKVKEIAIDFEDVLPLGARSCLTVLLREYRNRISDDCSFTEKDLYTTTMNLCYELLTSGNFHLYAGELDPHSEALALWKVLKGCAIWLVMNKFMTEEQYNNLCNKLDEDISSIG